MLILVGVSVTVTLNGGLFEKAKDAANKTELAREEEKKQHEATILVEYYNEKAKGTTEAESVEEYVLEKNGVEIGDTVTNYTAGGYTWQVLGVENGKLLLTTSTTIGDGYTLTASAEKWDDTNKKFTALENELDGLFEKGNAETNPYYIDKGANAERIRSIKIEDINRVCNFTPPPVGEPITVSGTMPNGESSMTLTDTSYYYSGDLLGKTSKAYIMLFGTDSSKLNYWTSSSYTRPNASTTYFGLRFIGYGSVYDTQEPLWISVIGGMSLTRAVRPVAVMSPDFQPAIATEENV